MQVTLIASGLGLLTREEQKGALKPSHMLDRRFGITEIFWHG
jgi:hypothetical protein